MATKKFVSDSPSFEEIRRLKKPNQQTLELMLNPQISNEVKELERELRDAKRVDSRENRIPQAPALEKKIDELKEESLKWIVTFVFEDIGRKAFEDLIRAHQPTAEQKEDGNQWNPETFAPALVSATCRQPVMDIDESQELLNEWGHGEAEAIFSAALMVCTERASVPFTRTSTDATAASDSNLTIVASEESPTVGS